MVQNERIAIVGMAGMFPGAKTLVQFWSHIRDGVDCSREVSANRWVVSANRAYQTPLALDHVYSIRGYFLDPFSPNLQDLDIDANLLNQLDPLFSLVLHVGGQAFRSAQMNAVDRSRIGVILGNIALPTDRVSDLTKEILGRPFAEALGITQKLPKQVHPLNRYVAGLPAGLLAKALHLGAGTFTLDAACASSLYAIKLACDELKSGRADAMLAGGVSRPDCLYTQMGFSQLRALSVRGRCSPFDAQADGLVVGEGAGIFVLKRLSDALQQGDTILGVIAGIGLSNDVDGNLLAPASEGQLRAMRAAYREAGWQPEHVDLIECHATGTPTGDTTEFNSLLELWSSSSTNHSRRCILGSIKSTTGHLLTGANAAGLAKVLLAMQHETLPPTANFQNPAASIPLADSPFAILQNPEPWLPRMRGIPRRAAISGFGFGGINAHLLLEEWQPHLAVSITKPKPRFAQFRKKDEPIAVVGLAVQVGEIANKQQMQDALFDSRRTEPFTTQIDQLQVPLQSFRIPPKELEEMLPQQLLILQLADQALQDVQSTQTEETEENPRITGVFLGVNLDLNTTNFHLRWWIGEEANEVVSADPQAWMDAANPPLTANRTMGALASIAASRIAKAFHFGGPSFVLCSEETSSLRALALAMEALHNSEIDQALVGGVDFATDVRSQPMNQEKAIPLTDGAGVVVLKRLNDAQRDGDRIYAVLRGVGSATSALGAEVSLQTSFQRALKSINLAEFSSPWLIRTGRDTPIDPTFGDSGAASGMLGLIQGCLGLYHQILPQPIPQFWLTDQVQETRKAILQGSSVDGNAITILLEEVEQPLIVPERFLPHSMGEYLFLFRGNTAEDLWAHVENLRRLQQTQSALSVYELGQQWWNQQRSAAKQPFQAGLVCRSKEELDELTRYLQQELLDRPQEAIRPSDSPTTRSNGFRQRVFYTPTPIGWKSELALVYPGSGNHFVGMGREFGVAFPDILRRQQRENQTLRSQYAPDSFWITEENKATDARTFIFGQVTLGTLITDLLLEFGIQPHAVLGYSLGESASLFGMRIWEARDEMFQRMQASTLFVSDLGSPYNAARQFWDWPKQDPLDWTIQLVQADPETILSCITPEQKVFLLIINTAEECVLGGPRSAVEFALQQLSLKGIEIRGVTLAHTIVASPVKEAYWQLHHLPVVPNSNVRVFSGAWGHTYEVTSEKAADSITAGLLHTIDFPRVVEKAYDEGVRVFLEVGPAGSCTRMIGRILQDEPHLAKAICLPRTDGIAHLLHLLALLHSEGVAIHLAPLYSATVTKPGPAGPRITIPVGWRAGPLPTPSNPEPKPRFGSLQEIPKVVPNGSTLESKPSDLVPQPIVLPQPMSMPTVALAPTSNAFVSVALGQVAVAQAHQTYLRFSTTTQLQMAQLLEFQQTLLEQLFQRGESRTVAPLPPQPIVQERTTTEDPPRTLNYPQCMEFAIGSIGKVLGPKYAAIDAFPTRVRLPDGPLQLVDAILKIEGEPLSLGSGRVVTEHRVHKDRWYLDNGRIPTALAVESGQADLFLSGFLGIDYQTRGLAVYRLLDAVVTFHRPLPKVGERIEYDIHIDEFFQQGETYLFRFRFESTVTGQPLLSMTNGCAGFFTAEELAGGKGIVHTQLDRQPMPGARPADWEDLVPMQVESFSEQQIDALRLGDLVSAFGNNFAGLNLRSPMRLPGGMLRLVHRVPHLDPKGGRYDLGMIRGEADIHPDDWFLTCHFVDDQVMPGTLMYECCLHTLRVYLMRMGWIGEEGEVVSEPVPEIASRLKCRGQVIASTQKVTYEITIKEFGYRPEAYAIADALMYADGKPIVEITSMSLRFSGLTRDKLKQIWSIESISHLDETLDSSYDFKPPIYENRRILAFAVGKPSEAFGEPYKIFDSQRVIARLPGPPYKFLDRITAVDCEPWKMVAGGTIEAQYDVPPEAWYFAANRCNNMPFSVLLEIALQPCGWLAAYLGSALTSPTDLSFRNLGGSATQYLPVKPNVGTLTTTVKITKVSSSGGMIIQHYDFVVINRGQKVYSGDTYFGFFSKQALAQQIGIREAGLFVPSEQERQSVQADRVPHEHPFPDAMLQMIDRISWHLPHSGAKNIGAVEGTIAVDPEAWFFKAHFYQDPVWPGSLGLESFLQLLKYVAHKRWGTPQSPGGWQTVALNQPHRWTYRGQVLPTDQQVTVQGWLTNVDDRAQLLKADGFLSVDGRTIYQMTDFSLQVDS